MPGPASGRADGGRLRRGLHFLLDCLNPGSDGIPLGRRVATVAAAGVVATSAVLFGIWVTASPPVADHVHSSEGKAQDRADQEEPPFAQTAPVYDWSGHGKGGPYESWALDRRLTAAEARVLRGIDLRDPRGQDRLARWARSIGARPVLERPEVVVTFQLRGTRTKPVVINQFRANVDEATCRTSKAVTLISFTSQGGGEAAQLVFDLDDPHPVAQLEDEEGSGPYQARRFDSLRAEGDPSGFRVEAYSKRTCDWTIEADWEDAFGKGTFTIDDNGRPFVIEAPVHATDLWVDDWTTKRFVPAAEFRW